MQAALWEQAVDECDTRAIDRILRIMERRAKSLSLDAPTQSETKVAPGNMQAARTQRKLLITPILAEVQTEVDDPSRLGLRTASPRRTRLQPHEPMQPRASNKGLTREQFTRFSAVEKSVRDLSTTNCWTELWKLP